MAVANHLDVIRKINSGNSTVDYLNGLGIDNKYTALSIIVQIVACVLIWIVAFAVSPSGDRYFGLMFYFYFPAIYLVSTLLGLKGESGMIAAGIYGIALGIVFYGIIFGIVVSYLNRRLR